MTYEEALQYIHSVNWVGSKLGLERTRELLGKLGNPHEKLKFIHIAGTNGKGSTAAMLSSILEKAGYRVGLYTSPFINRFNERMQVNGQQIPDGTLAELTRRIQPYADAMEDSPTEFELITALAMEYFLGEQCEIVVLETGMGGELDSTNVIRTPEAAVITAMGLDHVKELGPTMADIARAKGGIIKEGGAVVSYGGNPEADAVFADICGMKHAPLRQPDFGQIVPGAFDLDGQSFSYGGWHGLRIPLAGRYQMNNAAVVLETVSALRERGWRIPDEAVRDGMAHTRWPARFEVLRREPVFIVDGGHNPHGIQATAESLQRLFPGRKFTFVTGVMADKDVESILGLIVPLAEQFFTVRPNNPRAMKAEELASRISALGAKATPCGSVADGVAKAIAAEGIDGVACALGSLYMSGEVRECF
ncbi:MAG: bifunctional folylpolyglutamate synthase/dihydrofolate synthase [Oscillospiraceae bacterium]|jgi:dihydrofolate synthase/folylpolyglutamate synthase|nr:bifunctional folylpolyglutamate synthase/dihydrofolate synthase [Oscillospiraceae bacterium]